MNLYAEYLKERRNRKMVLIPDIAFATYEINGDECYIVDVYVTPEERHKHHATNLGNKIAEIAKEAGCKHLKGTVDLEDGTSGAALPGLLNWGYRVVHAQNNIIILKKDLADG